MRRFFVGDAPVVAGRTGNLLAAWLCGTWFLFAVVLARAHGEHGPIDPALQVDNPIEAVETGFGRMGSARDVTRSVELLIDTEGQFSPLQFAFMQGETIRFLVRNLSAARHEFMLGTAAVIREQREQRRAVSSDIFYEVASSRRIVGNRSAELIWQFTTLGELFFACLEPDHAAHAVGRIQVVRGAANGR